ncbi:MAG: methionyl-tRNA formyltransferase [Desulfomonilia bacterium]
MKLAFMGTPEFALPSLKALIEERGHVLSCIITQPDKPKGRGRSLQSPPVKELALRYSLPVFQPERLKANQEIHRTLESHGLDAVVVVAYGKMIPDEMLELPRYGFINVHASLLPEFRGAAPINRAIMSGRKKTGVSIMKVESEMDAGPVYLQAETPITEEDDAVSLLERLSSIGAQKLLETLSLISQDNLEPIPQDHSRATYAPMIRREEGKIDWEKDVEEIHNTVRGLVPWPCAYTYLESRILKILKTACIRTTTDLKPGTLIKEGSTLKVVCSGGFLSLLRLQLEGKRPMDSQAFACGLRHGITILGHSGEPS